MMSQPENIEIQRSGAVRGTVRPPGSKSITNRALICAALAQGSSILRGALDSEDTRVMIEALRRLGIHVTDADRGETLTIVGCGGRIPSSGCELYVANSGTTVRFLAAIVSLAHGTFRLDGTPRMRQRPIADLVDSLRQLGVAAIAEGTGGCPPVAIEAAGLPGGHAVVLGDVSSQFLSGLLLAAPFAARQVELTVTGRLVSQPYVRMTLAVMSAFGANVASHDLARFTVPTEAGYRGRDYAVEPDASAASYFFGAAAVTGGEVTVEGLGRESLQGDLAFAEVLERMGCRVAYRAGQITVAARPLRGIEVDMSAISDTVQTLAAVALVADGPTTITGVAHIRHKESDRIGALACELRKLGAKVDELADGLRITPGKLRAAAIDTYQDHRMAMGLALVGLRVGGVIIRDPACVAKTYPRFFDDLQALVAQSQ
jgi:3-phosphoshikimate 1-carboxyvinyltransferase